jgi:hypothetical protein
MKALREWIINFIYKSATGTKRIRVILTPLVGFIFFCIVLLLILASFFWIVFLDLENLFPNLWK